MELLEKDPWLSEGTADSVEQIRGMGLVPKPALDVMNCEVNRLLLLTRNAVVPLPYIVPRKVSIENGHVETLSINYVTLKWAILPFLTPSPGVMDLKILIDFSKRKTVR